MVNKCGGMMIGYLTIAQVRDSKAKTSIKDMGLLDLLKMVEVGDGLLLRDVKRGVKNHEHNKSNNHIL
jgi:hypothetical protein